MKRSLHRAAALLLAAAVAFGAGLRPAAAAGEEALDCAAAVLMEAESGQILYAYNADGRRAPASLTKLMTLLLVFEEMESGALAPEDEVTASLHASAMGGSQIWLEPYETMTVDELLRATAIASANDAAVALAEACAGTEGRFVAEMNERAAGLGAHRHPLRERQRPGRGRPLHHRPGCGAAEPGAAAARRRHRLHLGVAGQPPGRGHRAGEHQPPGALLRRLRRPQDRHHRRRRPLASRRRPPGTI